MLSTVDGAQPEQGDLPLRGEMQAIDVDLVCRQPTLSAAIRLCISLAGFESEKQVYMTLGIDKGQWSRIQKGDAHFPQDKLISLMDICGNEAPLIWLSRKRGYELKPLKSSLEKKVEDLERQLAERDLKQAAMIEVLREVNGK